MTWPTSRTRARSLPTFVQVTRMVALIVSEVGLNGPPPPAIVILAVPVAAQVGCGLGDGLMPGEGLGDGLMPGEGLGDGLMPGEGLGLGDGLMPGDGLGLGLVPWASVAVAPALNKSTLMITTTHWIQSGWVTSCVPGEWNDFTESS